MENDRLASAYAHCEQVAREHDDDRWRACLFAPAEARPHLHALYAFSYEVANARAKEPMAGEIRHQWWRDALADASAGEAQAHPVALALNDTIAKFRLPQKSFIDLIDARAFDLYDDPMPSLAQLEGYCGETSSVLMRLAAIIVAGGEDPGGADACGHAGVAYALVGLMRALPWHARAGQLFLPRDILDRHGVTREDVVNGRGGPGLARALAELRALAAGHWRAGAARRFDARALRAALLPAALVPAYLSKLARARDPLNDVVEIAPLAKMWRFWRAS